MTTCRYCTQPLESEDGRFVSTLSGDDGGTYDICEANTWRDEDDNDHFGGHSPEEA